MNTPACNDRAAARARYAYQEVLDWSKISKPRDTARRAKGLPVQLRSQGLVVALATLMREGAAAAPLARALAIWLLDQAPAWVGRTPGGSEPASPKVLLNACMSAGRAEYQAAETEALAFLEQIKLFSDACWGTQDEQESGDGR